ncbi:hypothetical protein TNCV_1524631 [Trichonephila clavipes]|nr:hypothetical protein TNCV_1524631 [Trichonephila clavipes]
MLSEVPIHMWDVVERLKLYGQACATHALPYAIQNDVPKNLACHDSDLNMQIYPGAQQNFPQTSNLTPP